MALLQPLFQSFIIVARQVTDVLRTHIHIRTHTVTSGKDLSMNAIENGNGRKAAEVLRLLSFAFALLLSLSSNLNESVSANENESLAARTHAPRHTPRVSKYP